MGAAGGGVSPVRASTPRSDGATVRRLVPRMTADGSLLFLAGDDVIDLLRGEEAAVVHAVEDAYRAHGRGDSLAPHSTFVRFPGGRDRMIALPAYLGGRFGVTGVKWIASFPANHARGLERASGVVVLSSPTTGRPTAI